MNYGFPYYNVIPSAPASRGILGLFGRGSINWSSILSNTQKTLGLVNQAIPVIKQVSPMVKNAKTMFKVMNEFKKVETPVQEVRQVNEPIKKNEISLEEKKAVSEEGPTFFLT